MKVSVNALLLLALGLFLALSGLAQDSSDPAEPLDTFGGQDTLFADLARIDEFHWTVTFSYSNDEAVVGLSIPFKIAAGKNRVVADSAVYTGGRVEHFAYLGFRCDTAIQCVTLGTIANLGPTRNRLLPGDGRLATVYVSSLEDKAIEKLSIDTTTTYPNNTLMVIADSIQETLPDMVIDPKDRDLTPMWIVRYQED